MQDDLVFSNRAQTFRGRLREATTADAESIAAFYRQDQAYLRPFEATRTHTFYEINFWRGRIADMRKDSVEDKQHFFILCADDAPAHVTGTVTFFWASFEARFTRPIWATPSNR